MAIITARGLRKSFRVAEKQPGFGGTLRHLLHRRYRRIDAVQEVSFAIEPGEMVGFLGPNGAGKTTTLKLLTGLLHPSGGLLEVAGHRPWQRHRAFLESITLVMGALFSASGFGSHACFYSDSTVLSAQGSG